jgi:hypothetical protein
MWAQQGANPEFRFGLKCMVVALAINLGVVRFVVPRYLFKSDVLVGRDFIAGPCIGPFCLFTGFLGYKCVLPFSDILHVNIKTRHGRIAGATVLGVGFVGIRVSFLKRPEAVLEVLYEKSSETTWHKEALFHFPQMALSEVRDLLDRHQKDKDSNERRHANVVSLAAPPRR